VTSSDNEHLLLPPASLTKLLTALVVQAWLPSDALIPVSNRAATVEPDRVGMKAGQTWSLDISLHALLIASANDAAYALAERVSGTVEQFAPLMRSAAEQLGLADRPQWNDPAGLDGDQGVAGGNLVSARDLAVVSRAVLSEPDLAAMVATKQYGFTGPDGIVYELSNHNGGFLNGYPGAIGVKTGFTDRAGVCVIEAATRGGRTMLAVVMNGTYPDRSAEMLLDEGFATPESAEPGNDVLPPVHEPGPVPTGSTASTEPPPASSDGPPATSASGPAPASNRAALGVVTAGGLVHHDAALASWTTDAGLAAATAVGAVAVGLLATRRSRRTRAHGRHFRRR
jgi:D-alanyl-D-alanine carboxypeptidase